MNLYRDAAALLFQYARTGDVSLTRAQVDRLASEFVNAVERESQ